MFYQKKERGFDLMATHTAEITMLYCPKCQRKYEDGSQRFCNNDGGRLLPAINSGVKRETQTNGVFTNLLARTSARHEQDEKLDSKPKLVKSSNVEPKFEINSKSIFKADQELKPKLKEPITEPIPDSVTSKQPEKKETSYTAKPISRLITPKDIKSGQAELGDRKTNPTGRLALTWQNPRILLGQTIKGRYYIIDKLDQDLTSIAYLAEDKILKDKKAIVRVLMQETSNDDFQNKLLAEERVSLSHINHPNIAKVFDSGELPEGKPFIVTEYTVNQTVEEFLKKNGKFNPMRTARIIHQASFALSEVHQNGILHRNLQPQHILLTVAQAGNESVKVTDFCISDGKITSDNLLYKSPEQLGGNLPTFASDSYSLAVIAFRMLTDKLPFNGNSERELLKSQKNGLTLTATNLNPELNPAIDNIFAKALAFNPTDRYPKARDFGEAFFNALTAVSPIQTEASSIIENEEIELDLPDLMEQTPLPDFSLDIADKSSNNGIADISIEPNENLVDIHIASNETESDLIELEDIDVADKESIVDKTEIVTNDALWEKRSPEPTKERGFGWTLISILGLLILIAGVAGIWRYFSTLEDKPIETVVQNQTKGEKDPTIKDAENANKNVVPQNNIDIPPPEREIVPPANFTYFENNKQNLSKDLADNYRGFSLYYPKNWSKFDTPTNFLDVKLKDDEGFPKQQFIVTRYESKGTFELDKANFEKLAEKSDKDLKKILPNYETVSQGEITVNNGWKAYEVKFQGKTDFDKKSDNFEIWGRRIWMPSARPGVNNGFVITMLATSLSEKINGLDDVGKTGELGDILYTFEPDRNY